MTTTPFSAARVLLAALAIATTGARAAELDRVEIEPPVVKVTGHDPATNAPLETRTVVAHIIPDPETLTTDSGLALLNDNIREAARKACVEADRMVPDDGRCYRDALASAKTQVAALVAHARAAQGVAVGG
jgi:UrcA family protein